jgi:polyisoprenoid-binding protein YceI
MSWKADAAHSKLEFSAMQAGARFDGAFREFEPTIEFDPADLAGSRFRVVVATATADTRDAERADSSSASAGASGPTRPGSAIRSRSVSSCA